MDPSAAEFLCPAFLPVELANQHDITVAAVSTRLLLFGQPILTSPELSLQPAQKTQLWHLQSLFHSAAEIRHWGGEGFSYPLQRQHFLQQLLLPDTEAFVLMHAENLLAFGQICDRFDKIHLARLLVLPPYRRQGFVRVLVAGLLQQGLKRWPTRSASLYVYKSNSAAIHSYQRLGFQAGPQPAAHRADLHFMTLPNQACCALAAAAPVFINHGEP